MTGNLGAESDRQRPLNAIEIRAGLNVSAHFYESQKVGDDRLGASVLVGSIVMKTIHARPCGRVH
jgi:hypothetical protein